MRFFKNYTPVDKSGAVAWSSTICADQVIEAYENAMFPWPDRKSSIYWFSPYKRGVLDFSSIHWSKTDLKFFSSCPYSFKHNFDFALTIKTCAEVKSSNTMNPNSESGTWITEDLISVYVELHNKGLAHSFEVYEKDMLVGGLYGIWSKTYFSAESMFYKKTNASKFALFKAIEHFKELGLSWIDTQVVTEYTSRIGAKEISRSDFLKRIEVKTDKL